MTHPYRRTRIAAALAGAALAVSAGHVAAAGFALQENSGSGLGNAYAGGAAAAEDAATVWSNPAGMSRIGTMQAVGAINLIQPSMKFSNGHSVAAANQPLGGDGGDAGSLNVVPNAYLVVPINNAWSFGIGLNAPFGLVTEYDNGWIGRYQGLKSDIKTINVNPAVSWKLSDNFTIGAGASYQQLKGTFTLNANYSGALLSAAAKNGIAPGSATFNAIAAATPGLDSFVNLEADDYSWGWNVGLLWEIDRNTRFGATWRSDISYSLAGNATFTNPPIPSTVPPTLAPTVGLLAAAVNNLAFYNGGITSDVKVPGIANISVFSTLNDRWDVMVDAQWTHWSTLQYLTFNRTDASTVPLGSTPLKFKDTWRISGGANYKYSDQWMFRGGVAWDQSPVQDADRTPRLPDSDRFWLAAGAQYKMDKNWKFDFGASYIWVKDGSINNAGNDPATNTPQPTAYGLINGSYSNNVVIVSGQVTYSF